jgi:transcription elongation GreA/GreB family factor
MAGIKRLLAEVQFLRNRVKELEEEVAWRKELSRDRNRELYKYFQRVQDNIRNITEEGDED